MSSNETTFGFETRASRSRAMQFVLSEKDTVSDIFSARNFCWTCFGTLERWQYWSGNECHCDPGYEAHFIQQRLAFLAPKPWNPFEYCPKQDMFLQKVRMQVAIIYSSPPT